MIRSNSEIGVLKKVIIHHPDEGIARISPKRAEELLFDDIVYLPQMQREHKVFSDVLEFFVGKENVLETGTLIREGLDHSEDLKLELLDLILDYEELPKNFLSLLLDMNNLELAEVLITGYHKKNDHILFDPIPNFIFTRDIAAVVGDHVIITKAAKTARFRENLLTRFIFRAHPLFAEVKRTNKLINLNDINLFPPSKKGENVSIEGGDMMILENDYLLIGCSERTTNHAIQSLQNVLFEKSAIKYVVKVNIPNDRSCMHIDTLFTRISKDHLVCFKPIVFDGLGSNVEMVSKEGSKTFGSVKDFILSEINPNMKFIFVGDGISPYQEREQWTDGSNLVALRPGVALSYDRNIETEKAFRANGYQIIRAEDLLVQVREGDIRPEEITNTIISLPSSELSRARGGSHCMTCPMERTDV